MRKYFVLFVLITLVIVFKTSFAQSAEIKRFYIGAGGTYAIENFDGGDYDNSWGANAKIGYKLHPLADLEFAVGYLDEFEDDLHGLQVPGMNIEGEASLSVTTYMIVIKGYFPISTDKVRMSVLVGGGLMHADNDTNLRFANISYSGSYDDTDFAWKVGLGADFYATQELSLGVEGNYTMGINDLDGLEYFDITLGVAYHF